MSDHTHYISPQRGSMLRWLVNLFFRITVKWRMGLRIDIAELRKIMARSDNLAGKHPLAAQRVSVECNGVRAEWLIPEEARPERVLLYIHGGAFVTRSPEVHGAMVTKWCQALNARALMVDYRLAPEQAWPAAADDCHATYQWLLAQGFSASNIVIAGDSAGGNLSLATLQRIKQSGEAMPGCAVLLSPFTDFTLSGRSVVSNAKRDPIFTLAFANGIRGYYTSPELFLRADVSPLFGEFDGLPPLLFQVGSTEMLLDDSVRPAARARAAGVDVQLEIWDRMPHVFQALGFLPQAHEASLRVIDFIRRQCSWQSSSKNIADAGLMCPEEAYPSCK